MTTLQVPESPVEDNGEVPVPSSEESLLDPLPADSPGSPIQLNIRWAEKNLTPDQTVSLLLEHAVRMDVSDLYFACNEGDVTVTVRHLGIVKPLTVLPLELGHRCIALIRALSRVKHGERRRPQDGRWVARLGDGSAVDLRLNTLPTLYGESLALRIFSRERELERLESLGFVGPQLAMMSSILSANSGLVLITGPTGCGKTTTMYACMHALNNGRRKIHTIEDPIEYAVPGIYQSQVDYTTLAHGVDFPEMLRGIVRQGPDVVLIGEVRDKETAETAVRAANSGQLIFATLHSATAPLAVQSLLSLGVSPYFLCTSLVAVVGQRLMRTLNDRTKTPLDLSIAPQLFEDVQPWLDLGFTPQAFAASSNGDPNFGYAGRAGAFEIMTLSPKLRDMVLQMRPARELQQAAVAEGMLDLRRAALLKVAQGITTFDEMQRVLPDSELWFD
ncbi:MAG: ATPase, T2SS/T4P/T4SS family [Pirellulaceae bacterium]|nr:ATPase, T2SS/T4P/T4SS family [Pirellulaceae bacterium]